MNKEQTMIYAFEIETLAKLDTMAVESALRRNYPKDRLTFSKFVGITNGGQFAYRCKYKEDGEESQVAVYVFRNNDGDIVADY
ncbi:MAG: hypothetical protein EB101_07940 [Chitinophagia bacterium]|nr:hypothetical protein [Chitinophagia bacterium]